MEFVYLGFLEQLQKAISGTVGELITLLFEKIAGVFISVIQTLLKDVLYTLWLHIYRLLLKGIWYAVRILDIMSGMRDIHVIEGGELKESGSLLEYLLTTSSISRFFIAMTVIALALAFLFSIYQTLKIVSDSAMEEGAKPISSVITGGIRCMLAFLLVPMLCLGCLQLSSAVLKEVKISFEEVGSQRGVRTEFSDVLFEMSAESARKVEKSDPRYKEFWSKDQPYQNADLLKQEKVYDQKKIDYFVGILSSLFVLVIMLGSCLAFVRRILDVLLLYVAAPFFAATIPLDEGKRFSGWRDRFIGTFFGCFGSIFAMRLYLILIPLIASDDLKISGNVQVNYIAKICFIIGSAWAIFKGQDMITGLIAPEATRSASESTGLVSGLAFGYGRRLGSGLTGLIRK